MVRRSPFVVELSEAERQDLTARARRYASPHAEVIRAKIVLLAADGLTNDVIAERLGVSRQVVSKWRKRFCELGLDGLLERRRGRPPRTGPPAA